MKTEKDLPELPFDRYGFSARDTRRHTEAQAHMTRDCMRRLGFEDFPLHPKTPEYREAAPLIAVAMASYPYGPLDLDSARRWGYGWDPDRSQADAARPEGRVMTDAEYDALNGGGRGSAGGGDCGSSGADRLVEGVRDKTRMWTYVSRRSEIVDKAVAKDRRVRKALATWSRCMGSKGVKRYKTPAHAFQDKAWGRGNDEGGNTGRTKKELATATADVECKREHNTAGVWWAVREEKQRADVTRHKDAYEAVRADQDRVRANAERVLGDR
ncbi:hypothetical protein [Streptomyces sp. NPDC002855]|uniref:hypothetical protein n=1 Tax=Streptomyces sp. NPDC002855 TaxID=3154437 RepID=UPI00332D3711